MNLVFRALYKTAHKYVTVLKQPSPYCPFYIILLLTAEMQVDDAKAMQRRKVGIIIYILVPQVEEHIDFELMSAESFHSLTCFFHYCSFVHNTVHYAVEVDV